MDLINKLKEETSIELKQKHFGIFIPDVEDIGKSNNFTPKLRNEYFFKNKDVYISKHNRYASYPEHLHEFLEFNYQLSGESKQIVNGEEFTLFEGDLLLMDKGSVHSIDYLSEDDILLNILFNDKMISIDWLREMRITDSILYNILLNTSNIEDELPYFLIFSHENNNHILKILNQMAREYFRPQPFSNEIISSYLPILLYELARWYPTNYINTSTIDDPFIQILEIINTEYASITLTGVAERLNYNKNYLSNLIKEKVEKHLPNF